MSRAFGITYPLWAHAFRGPDWLDRLAGEVGLELLVVPVVSGPVASFHVEPGEGPHRFRTEGGWHYPANRSRYAPNEHLVRSADWFHKRDWLESLKRSADRHAIKLWLRIDLRSAPSVLHDEHLQQRNPWMEPRPEAGACVSSPVLQELLLTALDELSSYEPAGIELVDWLPRLAQDRASMRPLSWQSAVRELLDVCFCASCAAHAFSPAADLPPRSQSGPPGVDPAAAARSAAVEILRRLNASDPLAAERAGVHDPILASYCAAVRRGHTVWLRRLAARLERIERGLLLDRAGMALVPPPTESGWPIVQRDQVREQGSDAVASAADDPRLTLSTRADGASIERPAAVELPVWLPQVASAAELVRRVTEHAQAGKERIVFRDVECAPAEIVTWLRQAVRFARR